MKEVAKYSKCFVCGEHNECGLQAHFYYDGTQAVTELTAAERFEGYRGIYHGGILATLLDEVMIKAILARDIYAVTAEMSVRFLHPVKVGDTLKLVGRITKQKGRVFLTEGSAQSRDGGTVYATATGKYIEASPDMQERLRESVEK